MTALKELVVERACRIGLAVLLVASMVPAAALSAAPAFAEDPSADQLIATSELLAEEQLTYQAEASEATDLSVDADPMNTAESTPLEARAAFGADGEGAEPPTGGPIGNVETATSNGENAAEQEEALSISDIQLESLETTVEEPWSIFAPFRLLFGANDTFTVPLREGTYTEWIDRLDLSEAPYARTFYNILDEASNNDGTKDWLIENIGFSPAACTVLATKSPASRATVGNVYKVNSTTSGILAAIVDDADAATATNTLTSTEQRVKRYINEAYGAFDRDFPASFWRDVKFGTVFVRDKELNKTLCFFALKSGSFDLRAEGYRSAKDIKAGIATIDARVDAINAAFDSSDAPNKDSDYARVRFYNQWICENNQYNTKFNSVANSSETLAAFQAANPDVWSAMSALSGRKGETGPVCEGYSRAMKLLCDEAGIGCVLVDGNSSAGPHMWNYVRMGSGWYAVDITWNNTGNTADYERYFLVGGDTVVGSSSFLASHPASNQFVANGTKFTNGPNLSKEAYNPNSVSFAGIITSADSFAYGDSFTLAYDSTTVGTAKYTVKSGPATITEQNANTPAQAAAVGSGPLLTITGLSSITVSVTLTPSTGDRIALTDTITVRANARPLKVAGTELAPKVYDGTTDASVLTTGHLVSARSEAYAAAGVLENDSTKLELRAKAASFTDKNAGTNKEATVSYGLAGDADTMKLYTLEGHETDQCTGTITKRPATAYFALSSSRMLLNEAKPTGTVRYEEPTATPTARGVVAGDDLTLTGTAISIAGLPDPLTPGTYKVTWTKPNDYVLQAINKLPAAANYDIALAEGVADEPATLEVVDLANTVVVEATGATDSRPCRVEARVNGINDDTLMKLADSGFSSVEGITSKLIESLATQTKGLDGNRVTVYDMTLYVKDGKGAWKTVTAEDFPDDGVRVTLDYPEGTSATNNSFYAAHMFTTEVTSAGVVRKPGEVEAPQVQNTEAGPSFTLMGFSPVSLAWDNTPPPTSTANGDSNGNGNGGGSGSGIGSGSGAGNNTTKAGVSTANGKNAGLNTTGDSILMITMGVLVAVICVALVALIAFLIIRRKKDRR